MLAAHRAERDRAIALLRNRASGSRQHRAVDDRQRGLEAADVSERDGFELARRLKRDAQVHGPDWLFNLHAVEVVAEHRFIAIQDCRQRRADLAESDHQGPCFRFVMCLFFGVHQIFLSPNHAVSSESIAR